MPNLFLYLFLSDPGAAFCLPKKPCTVDNYFEINTGCDLNNQVGDLSWYCGWTLVMQTCTIIYLKIIINFVLQHLKLHNYTTKLLGGYIGFTPSVRPYEEDKNYPIWRRQERRSKYAVQLASWQLRSNSPKTSVRPASVPHPLSAL